MPWIIAPDVREDCSIDTEKGGTDGWTDRARPSGAGEAPSSGGSWIRAR